MRKWLKSGLLAVGILIALLAVFVAASWSKVSILIGTQELAGAREPVPDAPRAAPAPLTEGEADWICWRGANGDGRSAVTGIATDWSGGPT